MIRLSPLGSGPAPSSRRIRAVAALVAGLLLAFGPARPASSSLPPILQAADTVPELPRPLPADTWESDGVRALMERGRSAREDASEGLESYEGRMWQRLYVGLSAGSARRERGVVSLEREAHIRWDRTGEQVVRWLTARRDIPIAGVTTAGDSAQAEGLAGDLLKASRPPPLAHEPGSGRIFFGSSDRWALDPLADTAGHHYRYRAGDTIHIVLPPDDRRVTLAEIQVEPRRMDARLVSASLWFDTSSGQLVRGGYRPARPFDLEIDGDGGRGPPGFLSPMQAEIRYVTVDHALFDFQWWIPRRFAFEGEARVGGFARIPVTIEWTLEGLDVNAEPGPLARTDAALPDGWRRADHDGDDPDDGRRTVVLVPPPGELAADLPDPVVPSGSLGGFDPEEITRLERELRRLLPPGTAGAPVRWNRGLADGLTRYNRIEGVSTGISVEAPASREVRVRAEARIGSADLEPGLELAAVRAQGRGSDEVGVYRRLVPSSEWDAPLTLGASVGTLLFGRERSPFHRAWGIEATREREAAALRTSVRLFAEAHRTARRGTHAHLGRALSGHLLPENPAADRGWYGGAGARAGWQSGIDPARPQLLAEIRVEGAMGTTAYGRGWGSAALRLPLGRRLSAAIEAGGGSTLGDPPAQRHFFPGGARIHRGLRVGERVDEAFWFGRAEVARGTAGARASGFVDVLGAGPRTGLLRVEPQVAAGAGISFLDGLLRLDLVRTFGDDPRLRLLAYLDGLL